jgi:hypothetical protein
VLAVWCTALALFAASGLVSAPRAGGQALPPAASGPSSSAAPPTSTATSPAPTTPTTLPHGDGGVTTQPPKGGESSSTTSTVPAGPTLPDPSGRVRALLAEIDILNARDAVPKAQQHVVDMQSRAQDAGGRLADAQSRLALADDELSETQQRLATLAISQYVDPGQSQLEAIVGGDSSIGEKRSVLLSVSLKAERAKLMAARDVRAARARDVARARKSKKAADGDVVTAQEGVVKAHSASSDAAAALREAEAHLHDSGAGSWSLSIEGASAAKPEEMAYWFATRGTTPEAQAPLLQLTKWFVQEGDDEGVRGDMAFAQSIVETGSFTNPDTIVRNNFAGVGHCDSCAAGFSFATPQLGIRAQIQLLKSYAEKDPKYQHPLVDKRLRGPAGCCRTWRQLTRVWATAPNYGPVILDMYRQLLVFVVQHRGGVVPPGTG